MDLALLRRLNLNHLATFIAISETSSFRLAAARLNISQSALSVHIRQLERTLEIRLFARTTRSVLLTPEGSTLLEAARSMASELTATAKRLTEEARLQKRILRVATVPFLIRHCPPSLVNEFCSSHPGVEVRLVVREASKLAADLVRQGEADIGLMYWNPELDKDDFVEMFHEKLMAVVPASEPRLAKLKAVTLRQLAAYPFVIQPQGTYTRDMLDHYLERQNISLKIVHSALHADAIVSLVGAGLGVGIQPEGLLSLFKLDGCRAIRLSQVPPRPIGIVLPQRNKGSEPAIALRDFILRASRTLSRQRHGARTHRVRIADARADSRKSRRNGERSKN